MADALTLRDVPPFFPHRSLSRAMAYRLLSRIRRGLIRHGALPTQSTGMLAEHLPTAVATVLPMPSETAVDSEVIERAEKALNGEFTIWNRVVRFEGYPSWQTGPETGYAWPRDKPLSLPADAGPPGELRRVWELSRHHILYDLGRAFLATGREEFRTTGWNLIADWIEKNGIEKGINWTSPLEMAVRATAWLWFVRMTGECSSASMHSDSLETVLLAMVGHTAWNLSLYPVANNHLAGEALLLVEASALFPGHRAASRWGRLGRDLLAAVIDRQILSDGSPAEQSPSYLLFTTEIYLLAHVIMERVRHLDPLPPHVRQRLATALAFLANLCDSSSEVPAVGDCDDSMFMGWELKPLARLSGLVHTSRVFFGHEIPSTSFEDESAAWFADDNRGVSSKERLEPLPISNSDSGGWILLRCAGYADMKVLFCAMPLGLPPLFGHGHAHALSIGLWIDGIPTLVDPGTYTYAEEPWRTYFKGTRAHSTIEVERKDQAESLDTFTWGSPYRRSGEIARLEERLEAWGTHTGYLRLPQRVTHKRTVQLTTNRLRVEDVVSGQSSFSALLLWQIHPEWAVEMTSNTEACLRHGNLQLRVVVDGPGSLVLRSGTTDPLMGWFSPRFDELVKGHTLSVQATDSGILWITEMVVEKTGRVGAGP